MINNILIICNDPPYPTIHGGRMDMWHRIKGFAKLGLRIQLIYWYDSSPLAENDKKVLYEFVDNIIEVHRKMSVFDLLHYKYPPRMMSCKVSGSQFDKLFDRVKQFSPDCVWLDLWYGYFLAKRISNSLQIPLVYRSQNVEFQYFQQLYNDASGLFKLKLFLNSTRMKSAELEVRTQCDLVYDISQSDNNNWKVEAPLLKADVLLPTWLPSEENITNYIDSSNDIDILFLGNLNNPSNVSGLKWFVSSILGNVRNRIGNVTTVFAGSNPSDEIQLLCSSNSIECVANPENVFPYYNRAKVIINPQLEGSGISMKMVELLLVAKPVVTTTVGVRGLPDDVVADFIVSDTPDDFSENIISCLSGERTVDYSSKKYNLEKYFGLKSLTTVINDITCLRNN